MTPDALPNWVDRLPPRAALYARLARFDRPAGIWLLFWPCLFGAFLSPPAGWWRWWPLFLIGSIAMRAAGCVYNDIVDRDLDAKVVRTARRPVAATTVAASCSSSGSSTAMITSSGPAGPSVCSSMPRTMHGKHVGGASEGASKSPDCG